MPFRQTAECHPNHGFGHIPETLPACSLMVKTRLEARLG